jgi:hypothetical protein
LRMQWRRHAGTGQNDRNQDDRNAHQYCQRPISQRGRQRQALLAEHLARLLGHLQARQ